MWHHPLLVDQWYGRPAGTKRPIRKKEIIQLGLGAVERVTIWLDNGWS